ncbi:hypothetical protein KIW84_072793 [Lathyrus oleraceus]|uniref:RNA cytosine-C(5)-methyltransferase NSUN2-like PUA domain-containing protein n=1 Tax=Pisum sativum TaxID=3888 RepID=A0A9D4VLY3_PEA|nr:hypothetical protein KIW84_072793 [Pisum sativum]
MKMKMEEQENLNLIPPTATLEIDKDLTLLPRIKLNLTVHPSTPSSSITNQIDEWKTKRALLDFLQTSHSLPFPLPEEDLQFKRFNKDLKKRKREDPVVYGTLHIWDLSFLSEKNENDVVKWRNGLRNVNRSSRREPDTVVVSGVPSRWFAETRVSSKPSMLVTHTIFSKFGKIRNWIRNIEQHASDNVNKILVGNKADMDESKRERQTAREGTDAPCAFRISSEGLPLILPYITKQIIQASPVDFKHLLQDKDVKFTDFADAKFGKKAENLLPGCYVIVLGKENTVTKESLKVDESTIAIGCWRGRARLSVMVTAMDCQELLERLLIRLDTEKGSSGHVGGEACTEVEQ